MSLCPSMSVCLCLSVSVSQVGVLLKRLSVGSHKQHLTIAQGLQFSDAKDLREIPPGSPPAGAPNTDGVSQNRRLSTNSWLYLENGTTVPVNLRQSWLGQLGTMYMQCIFSLFCISYILSQQRAAHVAFVDCWACKLGHLQPITGHIHN